MQIKAKLNVPKVALNFKIDIMKQSETNTMALPSTG